MSVDDLPEPPPPPRIERRVVGYPAQWIGLALLAFEWLQRIVEGRPTTLVRHGELIPAALHRERVAPAEVAACARTAPGRFAYVSLVTAPERRATWRNRSR